MAASDPVRSRESRPVVGVVALTALALVLRVIFLAHKGLWQDEVFSVLFARAPSAEFWHVLATAEANMALYYLALREWIRLFSSDAGVRMLSVIPGVLTVPAIYALAMRLYSRRAALWAAGLLTVNACAVVYSQEARGYSLLVLFVALSSLAFLRVLERASFLNVALYALATVAAFYSHFYAVFVVLAQVCALGLLPRSRVAWKALVISWAVLALAMIPGLRVVLLSRGSNLWWLPRPGLLEIYRTITFLAAESGKAVGAVLAFFLLIPICIALREAWKTWRLRGKSEESFRAAFAALGLLVPMVATMALSVWRPMFFHRFLIICLVPFLLLAAEGLASMQRRRRILAGAIVALSLVATAMSYTKVREDWRAAAALTLGSRSGEPVVFYLKDAATPFAFYRERLGSPMREGQAIRLESPPSDSQVAAWAKQYPSISVVRFPSTTKDPVDVQITQAMTEHYRICERRALKGISVSWYVTGDCPAEP